MSKKPYFMDITIKDLCLDKAVQMRCSLNRIAICDYAEAMERGDKFPPIVVFWIPGGKKFVADGFHRVLAAKRAGLKTIRCQVRSGMKREAILYAAGANQTHGVRRTLEDKRKTVLSILGDKQWVSWTDSTIARVAGVSADMVKRYRAYLGESAKSTVEYNGTEYRTYESNGKTCYRQVKEDPQMEEKIRGEICPYCGSKMKSGHAPRARGIKK